MYAAKEKKGHTYINVSLTPIVKVSSQGEVNYFGLFVILMTLKKLESTPRSSLYHAWNHAELKGHIKVSLTLKLKVNRQGRLTGDHDSFTERSTANIH